LQAGQRYKQQLLITLQVSEIFHTIFDRISYISSCAIKLQTRFQTY